MVMPHMAQDEAAAVNIEASTEALAEVSAAASAGAPAVQGGWTLSRINQQVLRVLAPGGEHVGNLQYSNGQWKFKAIGYDHDGAILPGWGPLTERHNTVFAAPDATLLDGAFAHLRAAWATDSRMDSNMVKRSDADVTPACAEPIHIHSLQEFA